jgi:hypothetical protein
MCAVALSGCGIFAKVPSFSDVAGDVADAMSIIDAIDAVQAIFFMQNPNPEKQKVVEAGIVNCRLAIDSAVRALRGAQDAETGDIIKAYSDFRAAYDDLQRILKWAGIDGGEGVTVAGVKSRPGAPLGMPRPLMAR